MTPPPRSVPKVYRPVRITGGFSDAFESRLPGGAVQYVTGRGYQGAAREITFL